MRFTTCCRLPVALSTIRPSFFRKRTSDPKVPSLVVSVTSKIGMSTLAILKTLELFIPSPCIVSTQCAPSLGMISPLAALKVIFGAMTGFYFEKWDLRATLAPAPESTSAHRPVYSASDSRFTSGSVILPRRTSRAMAFTCAKSSGRLDLVSSTVMSSFSLW